MTLFRMTLCNPLFPITALHAGRRRVQRAVHVRRRRLARVDLPRAVRPAGALPDLAGVLQPRGARLSGLPGALPVLLWPVHLYASTARGVLAAG